MDLLTDLQARTAHSILHINLDQITETTAIPAAMIHAADRNTAEITIETGDTNKTHKYQHHRNQPKAQIIFEYTDLNLLEIMQTVRGFINFIKANPTNREQFKSNKIATHKEYNNEVNESEIHASNLDQVQQFINEDKDIVFDALVAANYINEIDCTDDNSQQQA